MSVFSATLGFLLVFVVAVEGNRYATAPAFLWDNMGNMMCHSSGRTSRVSYEVVDADTVSGDFVKSMLGLPACERAQRHFDLGAGGSPEVVTVFLGNKLQSKHLPQLGETQELQALQQALKTAKSSLSIPHVGFEGGRSQVAQSLQAAEAAAAGVASQRLGRCGAEGGDALTASGIASAVAGLAENKTNLLLVCTHPEHTLSQEMELLGHLTASLEGAQKRSMFLYMSGPEEPEHSRPAPRILQDAPEKKCDSECMAFVYAIEAAILLLVVLLGVMLGMTCHSMVDTPSQFETPKTNE
uniref:Uncharacterized protein n=1 Tax=Tetraselmis sp. GSL018 TaxID=582737 RepID=A0A061S031_9CHLO